MVQLHFPILRLSSARTPNYSPRVFMGCSQKLIQESPYSRMESIRIKRKPITIYTPEEADRLMHHLLILRIRRHLHTIARIATNNLGIQRPIKSRPQHIQPMHHRLLTHLTAPIGHPLLIDLAKVNSCVIICLPWQKKINSTSNPCLAKSYQSAGTG